MNKKDLIGFLSKAYTLDLRALALMRIGMALVIIADLAIRAADLRAFFTNDGIWPTHLSYSLGWKSGYWSFHGLSGDMTVQAGLFAMHFLLALFLLFGVRTLITTILLFVFTISLHNRNLFIQQGGDDLLRLTLMWGIFLPWGKRYSVDGKKAATGTPPSPLISLGFLLLISSVYFFSALLKSGPDWHSESNALYFALSLEQLRLPAGTWIYYHPSLLSFATQAAYYFELLVPVLILSPWKSTITRSLAVIAIVTFHVAIGLTLYVGLFFVIGIVTSIALVPTKVLDRFCGAERAQLPTEVPSSNLLFLRNSLCIVLIVLSLMVNFGSLPDFQYKLRNEFQVPVNAIRLDQYWGMFSPGVLRTDGWLVYHGRDSIGRQWDLRLNQDYVDYKKPDRIVSMYKSDRWRKMAENLQMDKFSFLRPLYCRYILKTWNKTHDKKITTLSLYFVEKENLPGYKTSEPTPKLLCMCNED